MSDALDRETNTSEILEKTSLKKIEKLLRLLSRRSLFLIPPRVDTAQPMLCSLHMPHNLTDGLPLEISLSLCLPTTCFSLSYRVRRRSLKFSEFFPCLLHEFWIRRRLTGSWRVHQSHDHVHCYDDVEDYNRSHACPKGGSAIQWSAVCTKTLRLMNASAGQNESANASIFK